MESIEIFWPELKKYLISSRDCHFSFAEAQLEPQTGELHFDFSSIPNLGTAEIIMRKISGPGEIKLEGEKISIHNLNSRKKQNIPVDLFFSSEIKVGRPSNSIGKVAFSGIRITDNMSDDGLEWKKLLRQSGEYKKLYLKEEKLFAKQNGYLAADKISTIETIPEQAYRISENRFVFLTGCEISKIELKNNEIEKKEIFLPHVSNISTEIQINKQNFIPLEELTKVQSSESRVVFHSQNFNFLRGSINSKSLSKIVSSSGSTYLTLQAGGEVSFSIPELQNENYILTFNIKRLNPGGNGNGKVTVSLRNENQVLFSDTISADPIFRDKNIFLKGNRIKKGNKVSFAMGPGSSGAVVISKILIIKDFTPVFNSIITSQKSKNIFTSNSNNQIRKRTQNFSIYNFSSRFASNHFNHSPVILPCGWRAKQLVHKILSVAPKIKIYDDCLSVGTSLSLEEPNLVIGEIDFFAPGKRVYLFSWPENYTPSEKEKNKINLCQTIVTSSMPNYLWLKANSSPTIEYCPLSWPKCQNATRHDEQFYLAVFKNKTYVQNFFSSWPLNAPKVYVLGGQENVSSQFQNLSECLPYEKIFSYLLSSQGLIHFSDTVSDSKMLTMAYELGLPMLTNNTSLLGEKDISSIIYNLDGKIEEDKLRTFLYSEMRERNLSNQKFEISFLQLLGQQ